MLKRRAIGGSPRAAYALAVALSLAPGTALAQGPGAAEPEVASAQGVLALVDGEPIHESEVDPAQRVLALVDGEPIHDIDVERYLAFTPEAAARVAEAGEAGPELALDLLIDERLRFREIDRFGFTDLPQREIEAALESVRSGFASPSAFDERLEEVGLDVDAIRRIAAHRRLVAIFVEERLDPRALADAERMRAYYDEVLVGEARSRGEAAPSFDEAYPTIRRRLREEAFAAELARWSAGLREAAQIQKLP